MDIRPYDAANEDSSLEEFFRLKLYSPLLSHIIKVYDLDTSSTYQTAVAEDVASLLTTNRNDGNMIS
ncbi:hypothetical protein Plhal304r1_c017g0061461 [Plasmopara halstedii]